MPRDGTCHICWCFRGQRNSHGLTQVQQSRKSDPHMEVNGINGQTVTPVPPEVHLTRAPGSCLPWCVWSLEPRLLSRWVGSRPCPIVRGPRRPCMSSADRWALPIPTPEVSASQRQRLSLLDCGGLPQVVPLAHPGTHGSVWVPCPGRRCSLQLAGGCADMWGSFLGPDSRRLPGEKGMSRAAGTPRGAAGFEVGSCRLRASVQGLTAARQVRMRGPRCQGGPEYG